MKSPLLLHSAEVRIVIYVHWMDEINDLHVLEQTRRLFFLSSSYGLKQFLNKTNSNEISLYKNSRHICIFLSNTNYTVYEHE